MNFEAIEIRKLTFKKNVLGGFRQLDVNDFLRNVADDYETYDERIRRLVEEKERLDAELTKHQAGQQATVTRLEQEKNDLLRKIQQLEQEKKQLEVQKEPLERFKAMQIEYDDLNKMKRIAQQTLQASEKAANKLLEEAEKKKTSLLAQAEEQKTQLLNAAEEERLQYLFEAKLEISTLQKEQEQQAAELLAEKAALEQTRQELLQLKAQMCEEVETFAGMMAATRQEISQEYLNSIETLTKQNEAVRQKAQKSTPQEPPALVLTQEKEVM